MLAGEKYTVLIVDDDPNNRKLLERYLTRSGLIVLTARDAIEGLALLEMLIPDAILIDYQMPNLNGIDAARRIRETNKRTAIVMMTAFSSQEVVIDAIKSEIDDFLPKPLQFKTIPSKLIELIEKRQKMFPLIESDFIPNDGNIFSHFLIMKDSLPMYSMGISRFNNGGSDYHVITEHRNNDETLVSGFISAIKSFSTVMFGEELGEISFGKYRLLIKGVGGYICCVTVDTAVYTWMLRGNKLHIVSDMVQDILHHVDLAYSGEYEYIEKGSILHEYITQSLDTTAKKIASRW